MVVTTIRPNSNAKAQTWMDADFSYVDEVVNQPNAGDDVEAYSNEHDDNETFEVGFPNTIDDVDEVTNITIWTLGHALFNTPEIWLDLNGATGEQECMVGIPTEGNWTSNSFDGSWTQADLDALVLKYRSDGADSKADGTFIDVCYAVVTYSQVAAGYTHKFLGIAPGNIGKVCGIPTANVGKIKGV